MKILFSRSNVHASPNGEESDHERHSTSRSKSRKKSSKSARSPKRRSRFALISTKTLSVYFPFYLDRKNAVDPVPRVTENVVHVLDLTIVIVERKTLVNAHAHVRVHVPKDVITVVTVERIKNLDVKSIQIFFCCYIIVYEL